MHIQYLAIFSNAYGVYWATTKADLFQVGYIDQYPVMLNCAVLKFGRVIFNRLGILKGACWKFDYVWLELSDAPVVGQVLNIYTLFWLWQTYAFAATVAWDK